MKFKHQVFTLLSIFFALFLVFWKQVLIYKPHKDGKLYVVCTTNIIADILNHIGKDTVHIECLMGPGVDPHLYKPIEQDVTKIAQADVIFYNGLHLEARMADLFSSMQKRKITVAVAEQIPPHLLLRSPEHEQYFDPHVWFDPTLWIYAVESVAKTLQKIDHVHANLYETRKTSYITAINDMYITTKKLFHTIPLKDRILITGHDAFEYFARAYECEVISLQGISTASEAGTKDVQNLVSFIYKHHVPTIFLETSIPPRNIFALQQGVEARGHHVAIGEELYSDALGSPNTPEGTYIGMLTYNVQAITKGLAK